MESPAKVITAFVGVFVAGAVFGGFFSIGIGARWRAMDTAQAQATAPVATPPGPTAEAAKNVPRQKAAAAAAHRAQLLQVPMTWQAPALLRRYAERLDLTPDQKQRVMPLLQRAAEDYRRVQQNTFRETAIILQRLQQDLAKELTPEQRKTLIDMEEKQREAVRKMEERQRERKANNEKRLKAVPGNGSPSAPSEPLPATSSSTSSAAERSATTAPTGTSTTSGEAASAAAGAAATSVPEKRD